ILCEDERVDVNIVDWAREIPVLHLAVQRGDPELVRCLLRRGDIHVDARCPSAETALCWAAREGNLVIMRLLVEEGDADINLSGENGGDFLLRTPLHFAAIRGHLSVVKFLVKCEGVDINARDALGDSPLDYARRGKDKKMVRILCEDGRVDVNAVNGGAGEKPVLITATEYGHLEIVRYLLRRRDINVEVRSRSAETALCWAADGGNLDMVKLLLEEGGAHVNLSCGCWYAPWNGGELTSLLRTPLHFAAIRGHLSVVQFLVKCEGVDINARDALGDSPL
ncbi:ankyrin, partial [Choiromyces venosus 120613-1]